MALETLKNVTSIGGFDVCQVKVERSEDSDHPKESFIDVDYQNNTISFKIQNGAIKENGVNGCQVDTMIATSLAIIRGLNKKFPCRENSLVITKLEEALHWIEARKKDRENRGVEGFEKE